jgi:hypothetical protein
MMARLAAYQKYVRIPIEPNGRYALIKNRLCVVPWLTNSVSYHLLCLEGIKLGLRWLTRDDDANLCRKVHRILPVATIDYRKFRVLEDTVVCCMMLASL